MTRSVDAGRRVEEALGVGHGDIGEELLRWCLLDNSSGVHHRNVIGARGNDPEVVGHEDQGEIRLSTKLPNEVEHLGLDCDVESGGWLIGHEELRSAGNRDGDHHTLAHATRELVRVRLGSPFGGGDPYLAEEFHGTSLRVLAGHLQVDTE